MTTHGWCLQAVRCGQHFLRAARRHDACLLAFLLMLAGCTTYHQHGLVVTSQTWPDRLLLGEFQTALYSMNDTNTLTLVLLDGPTDGAKQDARQVATIRVFWKPRAGRTPIDPTATNATVHYAIFSGPSGREVGVYSGAGFVYPVDNPGGPIFRADIWEVTLRLTDRSAGFEDLLGEAALEGHLTATRDDAAVNQVVRNLRARISQRMGYPHWADAGRAPRARRGDGS